jgi:hypothetical protein
MCEIYGTCLADIQFRLYRKRNNKTGIIWTDKDILSTVVFYQEKSILKFYLGIFNPSGQNHIFIMRLVQMQEYKLYFEGYAALTTEEVADFIPRALFGVYTILASNRNIWYAS